MGYIMKYNIMDSEMEGKAKVNYNGQAPAKTLKMSFVPKHGEDLNLAFKMTGPSMQGWRSSEDSINQGPWGLAAYAYYFWSGATDQSDRFTRSWSAFMNVWNNH